MPFFIELHKDGPTGFFEPSGPLYFSDDYIMSSEVNNEIQKY